MGNCASCLLCCFKMCVCCGCRDKLVSRYAFYPPECSYEFLSLGTGSTGFQECQFLYKTLDPPYKKSLPPLKNLSVKGYLINAKVIEQSDKTLIPLVHIQFLDGFRHRRKVLIHSHANCTDIGFMMDTYLDLAHNLCVDVIAYDYSGYGLSTGSRATDIDVIENILSVYSFTIDQLKYAWNEIILYGQSLGSGPSTLLASLRDKPVGGLILHSGFSSGIRTILRNLEETHESDSNQNGNNNTTTAHEDLSTVPSNQKINSQHFLTNTDSPTMGNPSRRESMALDKSDFFPNYVLIRYVNCPILIIHGEADKIVPLRHMKQLVSNVKSSTPLTKWVAEGAGHNNIESDSKFRGGFFSTLRSFIDKINVTERELTIAELFIMYRASFWEQFEHFYFQQVNNMLAQVIRQSLTPSIERPITIDLVNTSTPNTLRGSSRFATVALVDSSSMFAATPNYAVVRGSNNNNNNTSNITNRDTNSEFRSIGLSTILNSGNYNTNNNNRDTSQINNLNIQLVSSSREILEYRESDKQQYPSIFQDKYGNNNLQNQNDNPENKNQNNGDIDNQTKNKSRDAVTGDANEIKELERQLSPTTATTTAAATQKTNDQFAGLNGGMMNSEKKWNNKEFESNNNNNIAGYSPAFVSSAPENNNNNNKNEFSLRHQPTPPNDYCDSPEVTPSSHLNSLLLDNGIARTFSKDLIS